MCINPKVTSNIQITDYGNVEAELYYGKYQIMYFGATYYYGHVLVHSLTLADASQIELIKDALLSIIRAVESKYGCCNRIVFRPSIATYQLSIRTFKKVGFSNMDKETITEYGRDTYCWRAKK